MLCGLKRFQHLSHFIAVTAGKTLPGRFVKSSSLLWPHDAPLQHESYEVWEGEGESNE